MKMVGWQNLHISGVVFDWVGEVGYGVVWGSGPFTVSRFQDFVHWEDEARYLKEVSVAKANPYVNLDATEDAYWRTLVADQTIDADTALPEYQQRFEAYNQARLMLLVEDADQQPRLDELASGNRAVVFRRLLEQDFPYLQNTTRIQESKSMVSHRGYFGRAPPQVMNGDVIAVLLGGTVPFLLRQDGHQYRLIGDCYVHGIMDGELFTPDLKTETLVIK